MEPIKYHLMVIVGVMVILLLMINMQDGILLKEIKLLFNLILKIGKLNFGKI
jgi:hypothetical protein